jgi:hypothetical protein
VDDGEIHRIALILADDTTAVENQDQIYGELGLPFAELTDLKNRLHREGRGSYNFFVDTLNKYKGQNGNQENLIKCFTELKLSSVIGELGSYCNIEIAFSVPKQFYTFSFFKVKLFIYF